MFFYILVFAAAILWLWAIQEPLGEDSHIEYCERFRREDFYYALKVWIFGFIPSMLFGMVGVGILFWLCCNLVNLNSGKYK